MSDQLPIPSISIEALLAARDATIDALRTSREMLDQAEERLAVFGVGAPQPMLRVCADTDLAKLRDAGHWDAIVNEVDRSIWARLFALTNIDTIMDHRTREELFARLRGSRQGNRRPDDALPPLTRENIEMTFAALHGQTNEFFERCVESVYKALSWDHKTNEPARIGAKLIITGAFYAWSRSLVGTAANLNGHESLHDLERVLCILDGQAPPTHTSPGLRTIGNVPWGRWVDVPSPAGRVLMRIKCFMKGTTHVQILNPAHVDSLNRIMSKRYPGALPEPRESKVARKRGEAIRPTGTSVAKSEKAARQAFYTPEELATAVAEAADIARYTSVLEPSAGDGALVRAALRRGCREVTAIENDPAAVEMLDLLAQRVESRGNATMTVQVQDFFDARPAGKLYDVVLMNPPFANAQEVEHVFHAWTFVKPGGRLVAIMSSGAQYRSTGRYADFRDFAFQNRATIRKNPAGSFSESGTEVNTVTVIVDKPK